MAIVKEERNEQGQVTYREGSDGFWVKYEYDANGKQTYRECCNGSWEKWEYDTNGNITHYENSDGYWVKYKYDETGKEIYHENGKYRDKEDIRVENVRNFMEQIEGLTKKGNYSDFEVALLICERSNIHSSEINKVMNISQSCDTLFSDYINDELRDVFENEIQEENELDMEM